MMNRRYTGMAWLALCLSCALMLTACGNRVLDYRNAQINSGKIYAGDSNSPFSGKLTNILSGDILDRQNGYSKAIEFAYLASPVCDVHVEDGVLDGDAKCKAINTDTVVMTMSFSHGALDGDFVVYDKTGEHHIVEATFKGGMPTGKVKTYSSTTYQLVHLTRWDNGVRSGDDETYDSTTGKLVAKTPYTDGKIDGEVQRYSADGHQLIHRNTYVNGLEQGPEDAYDAATGKHLGHADWDNGKPNGEYTQWDLQGNVVKHVTYDHGTDVEEAKREALQRQQAEEIGQGFNDPTIAKCMSLLNSAFRNEMGEPTAAQQLAWRDQCRAASSVQSPSAAQASSNAAQSSLPTLPSDGAATKRCGSIVTVGVGDTYGNPTTGVVLHDLEGMWIVQVDGEAKIPGYSDVTRTLFETHCGCLTVETNKQAMRVTKILGVNAIEPPACALNASNSFMHPDLLR
jgi:antitoxin component YwqK of YwqJK toxin-antitoxin module